MMEYFEAIHAGIRHKDAHIHTLLAQHGLHAHETAFIGDMQPDVETAHHAGITSTVSYTHLDVYKRQVVNDPNMALKRGGER